jgi:hypothetical protein
MRSAGNFHPEWGYLAPAPNFMRTVRIALVATAIGATAGAIVVVSLVQRPGSNDDNTSIAAHALVTSAPVITAPVSPVAAASTAKPPAAVAQTPLTPKAEPIALSTQSPSDRAPVAAQVPMPPQATLIAPSSPASASGPRAVASTSLPGATESPAHARATASAETPPAIVEAEPVPTQPEGAIASEEAPAKKVASKRHRPVSYEAARRWQATNNARKRWHNNRGFAPLLRLFSFRIGSSSSAN